LQIGNAYLQIGNAYFSMGLHGQFFENYSRSQKIKKSKPKKSKKRKKARNVPINCTFVAKGEEKVKVLVALIIYKIGKIY